MPAFEAEGLPPSAMKRKSKRVVTSYWRIPDRLYDDPEELAQWSKQAVAAAKAAAVRKTPGQKGRKEKT